MKHLKAMLQILGIVLVVAVAQYFVTDIPASPIFWPTLIIAELAYIVHQLI